MKKLLCSIALLCFCSIAVEGQSLTLDQLIYLDGLEQLSCDTYLTQRGWHFAGVKNYHSDSVSVAIWVATDAQGGRISYLNLRESLGQKRKLVYGTALRAPFEAIRVKVHDYGMAEVGTGSKDGLQTYYRGARYSLELELVTYNEYPNYVISISRHGLIKAINRNDEIVWLDPSKMAPEQAQRLQAFADSLDLVTQRLQAEGRAQRAAAAKRAKGDRN